MVFRNLSVLLLCIGGMVSHLRLCAQSFLPIEPGQAAVISLDGLVLRALPGRQQARLEVMPFGSLVEVIDTVDAVLDSLAPLKDAYFDDGKWISVPIQRMGHWVKVRYHGRIGYAFDAFLWPTYEQDRISNHINDDDWPAGVNRQVLLLQPGKNCYLNLADRRDFTWHGVYYEKGMLSIRPATLYQYCTHEDEGDYVADWLYTYADDNVGLKWLVGTKPGFAWSGKLPAVFCADDYANLVDSDSQVQAIYKSVGIKIGCADNGKNEVCKGIVSYRRGGILQELNRDFGTDCTGIELIADLDGDRKHDFIVSLGEEGRYFVLFLSSQARPGELVHAVATFTAGYCC